MIITIPKKIVDDENLIEGLNVRLILDLKIPYDEKWRKFRCKKEGNIFDSNDIIPYCPICGEESDLEEFNVKNYDGDTHNE